MSAETWAIAVYVLATFAIIGIMLLGSWLLGGRAWGRAKDEPFESGVLGAGSTRLRLSAKFYLVAMFFVIFDLEAVYLFAWSIGVRESGIRVFLVPAGENAKEARRYAHGVRIIPVRNFQQALHALATLPRAS